MELLTFLQRRVLSAVEIDHSKQSAEKAAKNEQTGRSFTACLLHCPSVALTLSGFIALVDLRLSMNIETLY